MSKHGFRTREPSISSERTLDNLENLGSHCSTPLNSPPAKNQARYSMDDRFGSDYRPGSSRPPHHDDSYYSDRSRERARQLQTRVSWQNPTVTEVGSITPDETDQQTSQFTFEYVSAPSSPHRSPVKQPAHMTAVQTGSDHSPVRRLKKKEEVPMPMERELSDAYIDSISRTPRYGLGRHNTYDDMLDSMNPEDPFKGQYQPSGKSPRPERKSPKPKRASDSRHQSDDEDMDRRSRSKQRSKKKKRKKHGSSTDGTPQGTAEMKHIRGRTNQGFSREPDQESVKSNGTFTVNESQKKDIRSSLTNIVAPIVQKRALQKVKSCNDNNHLSKQEEMDNRALAEFVSRNNFQQRVCKAYVRINKIVNNKRSDDCLCGRSKEWHERMGMDMSSQKAEHRDHKEIWHHKTHTEAKPTESFGVIQFQGFGQGTYSSPYIRLDPSTDLEMLWDLMTIHWKLPIPKLLISVTGGAQRFDLNPRLKAVFKRGLINAAMTTGAWIITGGTATGVMQFVGEAVRDHLITMGSNDRSVVALGLATWGCVANREALDGENDCDGEKGMFPASYSLEDVSEIKGRDIPLDHNHTHFILVDNGTEGKFGGEIEFRTMLERYISEKVETGVAESQSVNVPVVMLVVEGGVNTMKTVWQTTELDIPVLLLSGSGRAADFMAVAYNLSRDPRDEEKSVFDKDFDETMRFVAQNKFAWKKGDNVQKKISECMRQLKDILNKRHLVNVFNLWEAETKDIDRAILYALLKANKTNAKAQISLALAWNRCDIARHEIFTHENRQYWKTIPMYDCMFTALVQDRVDFVQLFMENGVNLHRFLSVETLWNLYANSLLDSSDSMASLLNNLILYLKQTWAAYLCCRPTENAGNDPQLLHTIGKLLVHLIGDENMNPYIGDKYSVKKTRPSMDWQPGNHGKKNDKKLHSTYTSGLPDASRHRQSSVYPGSAADSARKFFRRKRQDYDFKNLAERELFLFAILLNRRELGKMMWKAGQDQLGAALIATCILKTLGKIADDDEELELSQDLYDHANMYEDMAVGVLSECYKKDKRMAHQLLVRRLENYGRTTLFALADSNSLFKFMEHTCCQTKLNLIWKGRMALYTQSWKICLSLLLPFFIPTIKFTTNEGPDQTDDYDDPDEGEETTATDKEEVKVISNKLMPSAQGGNELEDEIFVRAKSRRNREKRKKLYRVQMFSDIRTNSIGILSAFYFFYTAPVSVFICNTVSYLVFLSLFSYVILTDLYPDHVSVIEYLIWGWTLTMFAEELRQVTSNDKRSIWYKIQGWFGSMWNRFDLFMYVIFIVSVVLRFTLTGDKFIYTRVTYSVTVAMYILRFMQVFFVEKNIGPKVIMIKNMLVDLAFFLGIFIVFLLSFGIMYQANLFPNSEPSWHLLKSVIYIPYWQMYGELFIEDMEGDPPESCTRNESVWRAAGGVDRCPERNALVPLLAAIYLILTNILLVNLLIAMFSYTFQKVQDKSEQVWRFYRYSLVYEFYDRPMFCPPFIIFNHIYRMVIWVTRKTCNKKKYLNEFRLNLNESDNNRLTLFVRSASENYLNVSRQAEKEQLGNKVSDTAVRLEKVIEELDHIKDHVSRVQTSPIVDETTPDTSLMQTQDLMPLSARRSPSRTFSLEAMHDRISDLQEQLQDSNQRTAQMLSLLQATLQQRPPRTGHLDITDMTQ